MPNPTHLLSNPRTEKFVLLAKVRGSRVWQPVNNAHWLEPYPEGYAAAMLEEGWGMEYVEWIDSGVVFRVVRLGSIGAYRVE